MSLGASTKLISLVPSNGSTFTEQQKVEFEIKPNISFVKGRDSYLSFDIHNNSQIPSMFYNTSGASSIINRMDIYSLQNGQLLESLTDYSTWCNIENQYMTIDEDDKITKEGCSKPFRVYQTSAYDAATNVQAHTPERLSEAQVGTTRLFTVDSTGNKKGLPFKFCIPLKSGVFNHWGLTEKLTPILLLGGLRIEITLNTNAQVLSRVVMKDGTTNRLFNDPVVANNNHLRCANSGGNTNILVSTEAQTDPQAVGFTVGSRLRILDDNATTDIERNITAVRINATKLEITVDGAAFNLSTNLRCVHPADIVPTYEITNMELKLMEIVPPRDMLKAVVKESQFDFISYETFMDNLPASSLNHNIELPSITERGKAVFTHYINNTTENNEVTPNTYVGNCPTELSLNKVQYFLNNKLYPLRAYNPSKSQDKIVSYNELVKAFSSIGKMPVRLSNTDASNIGDYNFTYTTARELARGADFVFSLKNAEPQIRLGFSAVRGFNTKCLSYVFSIRSIMINNNSLELVM